MWSKNIKSWLDMDKWGSDILVVRIISRVSKDITCKLFKHYHVHSYYEECIAKGSQNRAAKRHYTFMLNAALFEQPEYRITHLTMMKKG